MSGIAITFPGSPAEGQSYLAQNGFTYIYDSQKNRWKRGGDFVRAPKVLSYAGVAVTTTGSGITTGPNGALIYEIPGLVSPSSTAGIDSYKAYRYTDSYPNYTEIQVSISSAFSSVAYAATSTSTTFIIPGSTLSGNTTYYLRARQFVGSNASIASTGEISGYSPNVVRFITTSVYLDSPTIVSIAGTTGFPVYQIGFAGTTLPATVTYTGSGTGNLDKVEWRVTGPRNPDSTGDTALAEVGIGTLSSATLANSLVLAMPFSGAAGVGITNDVNGAIRSASGASAGTTKTVTANGNAGIATVGIATTTAHFYNGAAYFDGNGTTGVTATYTSDFDCSGNFTSECWVYGTQLGSYNPIICQWSSDATGTDAWTLETVGSSLYLYVTNLTYIEDPVPFALNRWQHFAVVYNGGILSLYRDGTLIGSAVRTISASTLNYTIGRFHNNESSGKTWYGYIQDVKHYKGTAKYTENFTPPLPTYGTISYTTSTIGSVGIATTAFLKSTGDIPTAEVAIGSSTAAQVASSLVLAMPLNKTFGFQDINVAIRGLTSGASAGTAKTVGLGTTSTANAPSHPFISPTKSKWYDGAVYFDKSKSQYCTSTSSDYAIGSNNVTIECWINTTDVSNTASGSHIFQVDGAATNILLAIGGSNNGEIRFLIRNDSGTDLLDIYSQINTITTNTWYHLAGTLSGTSGRIFVNGNLVVSGTLSGTRTHTGTNAYFGNNAGSRYYGGYIQDLKFYNGFAKYTANFTPPQPICGFTTDLAIQSGFTTTSATGALLSSVVGLGSTSTLAFGADQTYSGITSITSSSGITTLPDTYAQNLVLALPLANITGVGNSFTNDRNTQIRSVSIIGAGVTAGTTKTITNVGVTTVSMGSTGKWYGNAASFNGSSYLSIPDSTDFTLGSGDWCVEFWVNFISTSNQFLYGQSNSSGSTATINIYGSLASNKLKVQYSSGGGETGVTGTTTISSGTWYHYAAVRSGSTISLFVNGIREATSNYTGSIADSSNQFAIGRLGEYTTEPTNAYIQDFKFYKGTAKYTTNFTPPPPMFGDYVRSTPNKIVFTPGSDYVLEARNTATGGIVTSTYSATRQWGTKPEGGIYDPYASSLVIAIPGGAVGGATSTFDVTGQIRFETPTATYVNAGIVTYSNSLGIGTYGNKSVTNDGPVSISSTITKYYSRSMQFNGNHKLTITSPDISTTDFTFECWTYYSNAASGNETNMEFSSSPRLIFGRKSSGIVRYYYDGDYSADNVKMAAGTWYHLVTTKKDNTIYAFIDGILVLKVTSASFATISSPSISFGRNGDNAEPMTGYMNDIRIYKNFAKYTSNFTPPNQIYLT